MQTNAIVAWSSSDENIVTVDKEGKITASAAGKATIYCSAIDGSGAAGSCQVTVLDDTSSSFSGTVTSYGADDTITLELTNGTDIYTTTTVGGNQTAAKFAFTETIPAGEYTLTVKKAGHADYTETITVGTEPLVKEVMIYLLGDVNGDGKVNVTDVNRLFRYVNKQISLTETQQNSADVNKDGKVNITDVNRLFRYVNKQLTSL